MEVPISVLKEKKRKKFLLHAKKDPSFNKSELDEIIS
jgi:hypothetical protein